MKTARRKYTKEFKMQAIDLYESGDQTMTQVETKLGITHRLLSKWIGELKGQVRPNEAFPGNGNLSETETKIRKLERENVLLREEKEIQEKSSRDLLTRVNQKYQFISDHTEQYTVKRMCKALDVSRSGYYAWKKRKSSV